MAFFIIDSGQVGSIPFKLAIDAIRLGAACFGLLALVHVVELGKINVGHQFSFHMVNRVGQCIHELIKIFFVEENLVFLVRESIFLESLLTFGDRQVIIIRTGSLNIKKVSSLACFYFRGVDFVPSVILVFFHNPSI